MPGDLVTASTQRRTIRFAVGAGRVQLQIRIHPIAETLLRLIRERLRGKWASGKERPFILIRSNQYVDLILLAGLECDRQIFRNDPAIDDHAVRAQPSLNIVSGFGAQVGERRCAHRGRLLHAGLFGLSKRRHLPDSKSHPGTALRNGAVEQAFTFRRPDEGGDKYRSSRFAHDRHARRIAAEVADVFLDPLENRDGIHESVISGGVVVGFLRQLRMRKEAERAKAIVVGDKDDAFFGERFAIVSGLRTGTGREPAAIRKHNHRHAVRSGVRRGPDIHVKAVFARRRSWCSTAPVSPLSSLHTPRSELVGLPHAVPLSDRLRCAPAQGPDRRGRERNSLEDPDAGAGARGTGNQARVRLDRIGNRGGCNHA